MAASRKRQFLQHVFAGGFASDFGPSAQVGPDANGIVGLPFLTVAENVVFELDGGPHKIPGLSKLNGSALESGARVKGIFDFWLSSGTQHRVIHVGTKIKKDDGDGTFTDIGTGLVAGAVPCYSVLNDLLIISSDGGDVPKSWDGSTFQSLAGSPPTFSISCVHKNRVFAAGVASNPSRLYYSALLGPADWVGAGSGTIDIDPDDSDEITALYSHKNELIIFKGPHKGSIHRLVGSSPDDFTRQNFVRGIGAAAQNCVFTLGDDLGFIASDGTITSMAVTASYGDYRASALSSAAGIRGWLDDYLNRSRLAHAYARDWPDRGQVYMALPTNSAQHPNYVLVMDYRFQPVRISLAPAFTMINSLGMVVDATDNARHILMAGGSDGYIRKMGRQARSIDGTSYYVPRVRTPKLNWGSGLREKTVVGGAVGIQPRNDGLFALRLNADDGADQEVTLTQGGSDTLAPTSGSAFTLGTSTLAGAAYVDRYFEGDFGPGRSWSMDALGPGTDEDLEIHSISLAVEIDGDSFENP